MTSPTATPLQELKRIDVLNEGHVVLEAWSGDDLSIVNSARVSFDQESQEFGDRERGLINFLMREHHGTPFEAPTFRFDVRAPIFVIREHFRHRIGHSYNEESARYSVIRDDFYVPERDAVRKQEGKPGAYWFERIDDDAIASDVIDTLTRVQQAAFDEYNRMLEMGVAKELARTVLPVGTFSRFKWGCNLRSLMHFLALRNQEHAQYEIRCYAEAVEQLAREVCPVAFECFDAHGRKAP